MMVFLDMDGVLCDFVGGALKALKLPADTPVTQMDMAAELQMLPRQFWGAQEDDPDFWLNLKPYVGAVALVQELQALGFDVYYSTSPSMHPNCASHKLRWLDQHIGKGESRRAMIGPCKELLAGLGRVLVDDHPTNCEKWERAGGTSILFPQPWNGLSMLGAGQYRWLVEQLLRFRDASKQRVTLR